MAIVAKSDDEKKLLVLDDGFAASFIDGKWVPKALFNGYELDQHFTLVRDVVESTDIISQAKQALDFSDISAWKE